MKIFILFLFFVTLLFSKEVNIGVILPLSGNFAQYGKEAKIGLDIAYNNLNLLNNEDTINLIVKDSKSDKQISAQMAKKLIEEDGVVALIGEISSTNSFEIANIAQRLKTPLIVPTATNEIITLWKNFIFRTSYTDSFQGEMLGKYLAEKNYKSVVVINNPKESYSNKFINFFMRKYKEGGGVVEKVINLNSETLEDDMKALKDINFSAVVFGEYYENAAKIIKLLNQNEIKTKFFAGDGVFYQEFLDLVKDINYDIFVISQFNENAKNLNTIAKDFIFKFKRKYNRALNEYNVLVADSYLFLVNAINRCINIGKKSSDKKCIKRELQNSINFKAIVGTINLDKQGNAIKPVYLNRVSDGDFVYEDTIMP